MAKVIVDKDEFEVLDGDSIIDVCEQAGVPFSCQSGVCGTCQIEIIEGRENLSPLNNEENEMGMDQNHRLCCQCIINQGTVKITY